MNVTVYSREEMESVISNGKFPRNTAVISFYDPEIKRMDRNYTHVDYSHVCKYVFYSEIYDLDLDVLKDKGYTYESYFPEADKMARFIYDAYNKGMNIICQCEYGQSRSAGCAAAILEHFCHNGISIFTDYRYYPNQVIYHKVFDALENIKRYDKSIFYYHAKEDFIKSRLNKFCDYNKLLGNFSFNGKMDCINAKERIETFLRLRNLLCKSVTDAVNSFKKGNPFPFISLHITNSQVYYDSLFGFSPTRLISEYKYGCEKIHTVIWLYDCKITAEQKHNGQTQKKEIYFGERFMQYDLKEYNVFGTMSWDENSKELLITPLIMTDMDFN
ncbi:MAG: hypothetical protein ACI4M3_09155 [Acutalibacteraceae bacterium]